MEAPGAAGRAIALVIVLCGADASTATAQWQLEVVAPPELSAAANRIRTVDERPLAAALARAGLTLPQRVRVELIPESDRRAQLTPEWFVGLAAGTTDVVIFPQRVASYPYDSIESVLRHEIVHLALNDKTAGGALPRWFHEGAAVSIESGWGVADRMRLLMAGIGGPPLDDVSRLFESSRRPDSAQAYLLAAALVDDLRRTHGAALPGRVSAQIAGGVPFDRAFERETGETPRQAARRAWRNYQRWTSWLPAATGQAAVWTVILLLAFAAFFTRLWQRAQRRRHWREDEDDQLSE